MAVEDFMDEIAGIWEGDDKKRRGSVRSLALTMRFYHWEIFVFLLGRFLKEPSFQGMPEKC